MPVSTHEMCEAAYLEGLEKGRPRWVADLTTKTLFERQPDDSYRAAYKMVDLPIDYVALIGRREIEWKAAAEDHVDEIERLKAEIAALKDKPSPPADQIDKPFNIFGRIRWSWAKDKP